MTGLANPRLIVWNTQDDFNNHANPIAYHQLQPSGTAWTPMPGQEIIVTDNNYILVMPGNINSDSFNMVQAYYSSETTQAKLSTWELHQSGANQGDVLTFSGSEWIAQPGPVGGDKYTVSGNGITSSLSIPGYETWTGRFWIRGPGQEKQLDLTQAVSRLIKPATLDFTNYVIDDDPSNGFIARFEGIVTPAYTENYTLVYNVDDGVRVWLDDRLVVNCWDYTNGNTMDGSLQRNIYLGSLTKDNPYLMRVEWYQSAGTGDTNPNRLYIGWQSDSQALEAIPVAGAKAQASSGGAVLPTGGLTGYVLTKNSNVDNDYGWQPTAAMRGIRLSDVLPAREVFVPPQEEVATNWGSQSATYQAVVGFQLANLELAASWSGYYNKYIQSQAAGTVLQIQTQNGDVLASATVPAWPDPCPDHLVLPLDNPVPLAAGQIFVLASNSANAFTLIHSTQSSTRKIKFLQSGSGYPAPVNFASGATQPKEVQGPLDTTDMPILQSESSLPSKAWGIIDDGHNAPHLAYRRSDGGIVGLTSGYFWQASYQLPYGETNPNGMTMLTGIFSALPLGNPSSDWNAEENAWICPADGVYQVSSRLRIQSTNEPGGAVAGSGGYAIGADITNRRSDAVQDYPWLNWVDVGTQGSSLQNVQTFRLTAGSLLWLWGRANTAVHVKYVEMTIIRVA